MWKVRWNPSSAKVRMRESLNQPIRFQKSKIWKESQHFQGLGYWDRPNIKTAEICKTLILSLTAAKLGQVLHFKGFVMKEANCFFVYFSLIEWQLLLFKNWLSANFVFGFSHTIFFSRIRSFAHEKSPKSLSYVRIWIDYNPFLSTENRFELLLHNFNRWNKNNTSIKNQLYKHLNEYSAESWSVQTKNDFSKIAAKSNLVTLSQKG